MTYMSVHEHSMQTLTHALNIYIYIYALFMDNRLYLGKHNI